MAVQAACRGGSFAVESVAAFAWNGWQASSGISGNLGLEYAVPLKQENRKPICTWIVSLAGKAPRLPLNGVLPQDPSD